MFKFTAIYSLNTGNGDLNISDITLSDDTNFVLDLNGGSNPCTVNNPIITSGNSCTINIAFCPSSSGSFNADLTISSNDPDTPVYSVSISGMASDYGWLVTIDGTHIISVLYSDYPPDPTHYLKDAINEEWENLIQNKIGTIQTFLWSRDINVPRGKLSSLKVILQEFTNIAKIIWEEYKKVKEEKRERIKTSIEDLRWKPFDEIK